MRERVYPDDLVAWGYTVVLDTWIDVNQLVGLTGDEALRGLGHTTHQMEKAPHKAIFIWCNDQLSYPKALARSLDRTDLAIIGPFEVVSCLRGARHTPFVYDHAWYEHTLKAINKGYVV